MDGMIKHLIQHDGEWIEVLSQKEVADELGVTPPNISYYLKRETPFNTVTDSKGIKWIVKDATYENWKVTKAGSLTKSKRKVTIERGDD